MNIALWSSWLSPSKLKDKQNDKRKNGIFVVGCSVFVGQNQTRQRA